MVSSKKQILDKCRRYCTVVLFTDSHQHPEEVKGTILGYGGDGSTTYEEPESHT